MTAIMLNYPNLEELLFHIDNGVVVVHQRSSGTYVMLNNLLTTYIDERKAMRKKALNVFPINELHPLYKEVSDTFGQSNNSVVIVIKNKQISEVLFSPITKNKMINALQKIDGSAEAS